jgi:hypothetical protein
LLDSNCKLLASTYNLNSVICFESTPHMCDLGLNRDMERQNVGTLFPALSLLKFPKQLCALFSVFWFPRKMEVVPPTLLLPPHYTGCAWLLQILWKWEFISSLFQHSCLLLSIAVGELCCSLLVFIQLRVHSYYLQKGWSSKVFLK